MQGVRLSSDRRMREEKKILVGASQEAKKIKLLNVVSLGTQLRKESLDVDW